MDSKNTSVLPRAAGQAAQLTLVGGSFTEAFLGPIFRDEEQAPYNATPKHRPDVDDMTREEILAELLTHGITEDDVQRIGSPAWPKCADALRKQRALASLEVSRE